MRLLQGQNRLGILLIAVVILVLIVLFVLNAIQNIQQAPITLGTPSGTITFISDRDGTWDIFTLDPDGTLTNLTADDDGQAAHDYFPSYSLNGEQLNFFSTRTGELSPTEMKADGSETRTLDILTAVMSVVQKQLFDWDASWSLNDQTVVWASVRDLNLEIYTIESDQTVAIQNATRITNSPARDWFHTWSPNGEQILLNSDRNGDEDIYLYALASDELSQLTDHQGYDIHGAFTLDGEQIVYVSEQENPLLSGQLDLYLIRPDGTDDRPIQEDEVIQFDPLGSPTGDEYIYVSNESGTWHLYAFNQDTEEIRALTEGDSNNLFPVWKPS